MIFDFSDKINQHGLKIIFSNAEESSILTKKAIVSMSQTHSTNIEVVNNKKLVYSNVDGIFHAIKIMLYKLKQLIVYLFFLFMNMKIFLE